MKQAQCLPEAMAPVRVAKDAKTIHRDTPQGRSITNSVFRGSDSQWHVWEWRNNKEETRLGDGTVLHALQRQSFIKPDTVDSHRRNRDQPAQQQHKTKKQHQSKRWKLTVIRQAWRVPAVAALNQRDDDGRQHEQQRAELQQPSHRTILRSDGDMPSTAGVSKSVLILYGCVAWLARWS